MLKKECKWANIIHTPLENIPLVHTISSAKKKDVTKLLVALFDKDWKDNEALSRYLSVYYDTPDTGEEQDSIVECDCLEDDCAIHM